MSPVSVRYIVDDLDTAIDFYRDDTRLRESSCIRAPTLRDALPRRPAPAAQRSQRAEAAAGRPCPTASARARRLEPLPARGRRPRTPRYSGCAAAGARFRNEIVEGMGGNQILLEDPSGNAIELFQDTR